MEFYHFRQLEMDLLYGQEIMENHIYGIPNTYHYWRREWQPTPVFLPGKLHGQRNLEVYSPWGHKESDTTELLTLNFLFTRRTALGLFRGYQCNLRASLVAQMVKNFS